MKQGKENFEIVKDDTEKKGNYIFQKDKLTSRTTVFIAIVLFGLILFLAYIFTTITF